MPIYEFNCSKCQHIFEELVFGGAIPACPHCGNQETQKLISRPALHTGSASQDDGGYASAGAGGCGCSSCAGGSCASCGH